MSQETLYVQCQLKSAVSGNITTCWLDKIDKFSVGQFITLKSGGDERWEVLSRGSKSPKHLLHTDWKVGGLG